ncbi:hypothetical protein [Nocardioides guangzhouensis]|uniref:hypothetical protein n=1 Tax=Nocardioides guangzhouensis TaxID=2497878 RepID=UPI00158C456E|nr:hypothetical protein [Nocardioides guangzhouensis]
MVVLACLAAAVAVTLAAQPGSAAGRGWTPPPDTIVRVTGNAQDGFGIHHYDGSALFPPTDSEAIAECNEYDTRVARVRCRVGVRVWYRDLADLKQALRLAHRS